MSELLDRIHGEIRARLKASEAAVRESERLEAALAALDGVGPRVERTPTPRGTRTPPAAKATAKRAPRGANRQAALRAIADRPGISAGELVAATGINRPVAYALLSLLVDQGEIVKQDSADRAAGYALASAAATAVTDLAPESPVIDDPAEPQADTATPAEAPPADVGAAEAVTATDTEPAPAAPRTRRRAKSKAAPLAAPDAAAPPAIPTPAGHEPSALPDDLPPGSAEPVEEQPPVAADPKPRPKRRAAKPRAGSRPSRRSKPKPKPAG